MTNGCFEPVVPQFRWHGTVNEGLACRYPQSVILKPFGSGFPQSKVLLQISFAPRESFLAITVRFCKSV